MEIKSKELYDAPATTVVELKLEGNLLTVSKPPKWYDEEM